MTDLPTSIRICWLLFLCYLPAVMSLLWGKTIRTHCLHIYHILLSTQLLSLGKIVLIILKNMVFMIRMWILILQGFKRHINVLTNVEIGCKKINILHPKAILFNWIFFLLILHNHTTTRWVLRDGLGWRKSCFRLEILLFARIITAVMWPWWQIT